jgi:hypothetical protein
MEDSKEGSGEKPPVDLGLLAHAGTSVKMLQTALSLADSQTRSISSIVRRMIAGDEWRAFVFPDAPDRFYRWDAAEFRKFIESPRREGGCEVPIEVLERMIRDTEAWEPYQKLMRGETQKSG